MNPGEIREEKKQLRIRITSELASLTKEESAFMGTQISRRLLDSPEWRDADLILAFLPFPGEFDPGLLLRTALSLGKELGLPRLTNRTRNLSLGRDMEFHRIRGLDGPWDSHPYGIREPFAHDPAINPGDYAPGRILVITPGLGFDTRAFRLGRGGGYYDTYISRFREHLVLAAPAYPCQMVHRIPAESHDSPLDLIVLPDKIIRGGKR